MGRPTPSALLPIVRSDALARVLAECLLGSEPMSIRELSDRSSLPYSTVQREVDRLERAGILRSGRQGTSRLVKADQRYPYLRELRALILKAYGPAAVLADLMSGVAGVEQAFVFGSWARRYEGDWGAAPRDIDLLVVGAPSVEQVDGLALVGEAVLGQPVQATIVSTAEWRARASAFVRSVRSAPHVELAVG